jgi:hypothetical protein
VAFLAAFTDCSVENATSVVYQSQLHRSKKRPTFKETVRRKKAEKKLYADVKQ